jgi:hypothetical protein
VFQSLVFICKVLQNIANGVTDKMDTYGNNTKDVKKFIETRIPILKEYSAKLTVRLFPFR